MISILIVTWNRKEDTLETIQSIYDQDYSDFEIIVVDNGSRDGTVAAISKKHPQVRLVELDRNLGATGGRNAGIRIAEGEIILCLDSDASPDRHALQRIVKKFEQNDEIGVINSKIVNAYTRKPDGIAGWAYSEKQRKKIDQEFFSFNFSEGGCAIRKDVLEKTGLFWEKLFFGREGEELAIRVLDAGYKILYFPGAVFYHRVSPNQRITSSERLYYDFRNCLYIYLVHYPWWLLVWFMPLKIISEFVRGLRRKDIRWIITALRDVAKDLPAVWREREPIKNSTARMYVRFQRQQGALNWSFSSWLKYKT